jgi:hypothetical protein
MSVTQIKVTRPTGEEATFSIALLERVTLAIAGGGHTEAQTRNAMAMGHKVREGKTARSNGYTVAPVGRPCLEMRL